MSADWTAPKLRHATILIKTDLISWCDVTRRDAARRCGSTRVNFPMILGIQRLSSRIFVEEKEFTPRNAQCRLFNELISFLHLIKRFKIILNVIQMHLVYYISRIIKAPIYIPHYSIGYNDMLI